MQKTMKCKQNACSHLIWMEKNSSSLDFGFISLPNPAVVENRVCWHLWKMMLCMMFWSIQAFSEQQIYWTFPLFRAPVDFLFTIFICHFSELHHFGFASLLILEKCCTHFLYHWRKMHNIWCQLMQISERQCDPCVSVVFDLSVCTSSMVQHGSAAPWFIHSR